MDDPNINNSRAIREVGPEDIKSGFDQNIQPGDEVDFINNIKNEMNKSSVKFQSEQIEELRSFDKDNGSEHIHAKSHNLFQSNFFYSLFNFAKFFGLPALFFSIIIISQFVINNIFVNIFLSIVFIILTGYNYKNQFANHFKKSFKLPLEILDQISKGKLAIDIVKDQELSDMLGEFAIPLNRIIYNISEIVKKVELSALDLAGNSDSLTYFATSMANKTNEETQSINKIDSFIKNFNNAMQEIKGNVKSAYDISITSIKEADESSSDILSLIEEMNTISEMSDKIVTTMNFIEEIAEETNLLALNAAIQAAHAGEEGRGFSVVATEVKNLADSSSKATKTIYQIIERTISSISKGVKVSEKAKKALTKIISLIKSTEDIMSNISESINNQSKSTIELKESLEVIHTLINEINIDTQNMKSAISNLSGQAQILKQLISIFEVNKDNYKPDDIFGIDQSNI